MKKDFDYWNSFKKGLDIKDKYLHPKEKEIWWCSVGLNVGSEVLGKGKFLSRPVLVINAESSESFIGIPLTSKLKNTKYACIIKTEDQKLHTALIYQVKNFDKRRLIGKAYLLNDAEYKKLKDTFLTLYKI